MKLRKSCYSLYNKPHFKNGDRVLVMLPNDPKSPREGKIVGHSEVDVFSYWLVDFGEDYSKEHPYPVVSIPHILIVEQN
jgi:hypothetical protein